MSKTLLASCQAKIVTASGVPVATAEILSEGVGSSEGVLILDEDTAFFLTSNASDIKTLLEKIVDALGKITDSLTTLDTSGFWIADSTPSPPQLASNITDIQGLTLELNTLKDTLK